MCLISNTGFTCPNHLILPVRSTTSKTWMPSFVRRESELTSSFALTLQIQRIMERSLRRRRFSVSAFMAQVSAACSITLLTHDEYTLPLVRRGTWRLVRRGSNIRNLPHAHLQRVIAASSQPPPAESNHVPKVAELWYNFELFIPNLNLVPESFHTKFGSDRLSSF